MHSLKFHIHLLKFHPKQCIYTDGSFIPPTKNSKGQIEGNIARSRIYSPSNNTKISEWLPGYQNILRAKLNAKLIAIKTIQHTQLDTYIFTKNLNSIFLINNHIQHPTSQHHHLDKLLIIFFCKTNILDRTYNPPPQSTRTFGHYRKWNSWYTSQ